MPWEGLRLGSRPHLLPCAVTCTQCLSTECHLCLLARLPALPHHLSPHHRPPGLVGVGGALTCLSPCSGVLPSDQLPCSRGATVPTCGLSPCSVWARTRRPPMARPSSVPLSRRPPQQPLSSHKDLLAVPQTRDIFASLLALPTASSLPERSPSVRQLTSHLG